MRVVLSAFRILPLPLLTLFFFFFNDTATTEIYTLSLHDALPILLLHRRHLLPALRLDLPPRLRRHDHPPSRSEEHTSELQSQSNLVCRLLLEKKKAVQTGSLANRPRSRSRHSSQLTRSTVCIRAA